MILNARPGNAALVAVDQIDFHELNLLSESDGRILTGLSHELLANCWQWDDTLDGHLVKILRKTRNFIGWYKYSVLPRPMVYINLHRYHSYL